MSKPTAFRSRTLLPSYEISRAHARLGLASPRRASPLSGCCCLRTCANGCPKHLALFISDVVDTLDLAAIMKALEKEDDRGRAGYHPAMMVKLLVHAYCVGKPSSRRVDPDHVEPVFGQIKEVRGFRRFLLRGVDSVRAEFGFIALTHKLLKLFRSGKRPVMA